MFQKFRTFADLDSLKFELTKEILVHFPVLRFFLIHIGREKKPFSRHLFATKIYIYLFIPKRNAKSFFFFFIKNLRKQ